MQEFTLPDKVRFTEELGFDISFQEVCIRGSKHKLFEVKVTEEGSNEFLLTDTYQFKSWNSMKKQYPNLMDFLKEISNNEKWSADWRDNDRIFYIKSVEGHEGLYEVNDVVYFDAQEENNKIENPIKEKVKKSKPKK